MRTQSLQRRAAVNGARAGHESTSHRADGPASATPKIERRPWSALAEQVRAALRELVGTRHGTTHVPTDLVAELTELPPARVQEIGRSLGGTGKLDVAGFNVDYRRGVFLMVPRPERRGRAELTDAGRTFLARSAGRPRRGRSES